jgi:regulator of RNase E activity RraA
MMQDDVLFRTINEKLFTAVLGDVMDVAGLTRQFLPPSIRSLQPDGTLVGRAMPVLEADCCGDDVGHSGRPEPFGLMFRALDDLKPGEVYITTGASPTYALWGGLMSTRAKSLGAAGTVLDGYHRDTREIRGLDFPVFSFGAYAQDQKIRGRVVDFRCAIAFRNGVVVRPGDLIVGDIDGVLVVPKDRVTDIVAAALTKVEGEEAVRQMILDGQSTQSIFDKTGIM